MLVVLIHMKTIICGSGDVGYSIADKLSKENFEVTTSSYIDKIDDNQILDIYNVKSKCNKF